MATASFDRSFVIDDSQAQDNLFKILAEEDKKSYWKKDRYVYNADEKERSDALLVQCLSCFKD